MPKYTINVTINDSDLAKVKADVAKARMKKDTKAFITAMLNGMEKANDDKPETAPPKAAKVKTKGRTKSSRPKAAWKLDAEQCSDNQLQWLAAKCQEIWDGNVATEANKKAKSGPLNKALYMRAVGQMKAIKKGSATPKQVVGCWNILMGAAENIGPNVVSLRDAVAAKIAA